MQALVIGYVWPEPQSTAAGSRMLQLLDFLVHNQYEVTFATTASPTPYSVNLEDLGIHTVETKLNDPGFDDFLIDLNPPMVIFDRFMTEEQFGWRVALHCPEALRILDTEDLHFLRKKREKELKENTAESPIYSDIALREIASIYRCDLSLIISLAEMDLLNSQFNIPLNLLLYLPILFDTINQNHIHSLPGYEERNDFICIGNFKHAPNVDAVKYLKDEIWPLIYKQVTQAKMLVYGAYASQKIESLNDPAINFLIKGRAKDSREVVKNARVSLAPLRFGAGLKGKVLEAMFCGTPFVTTTIGAEGIINSGKKDQIYDDPVEFAKGAVQLFLNKDKWHLAAYRGFGIINSAFEKSQYYNSLLERLLVLKKDLAKHREGNFTGAMLQHHQLKSTYFLSKYIETKNSLEKLIQNK